MNKKKTKVENNTRNEVLSTFAKFGLFNGEIINGLGNSIEAQRLSWFLNNGIIEPYECPDAYIKVDNQVLIIEHFAIDGFDTYSNGGSRFLRHESMVNRVFEDKIAKETNVNMSTQIGIPSSYLGFIKSCQNSFDNHYFHIPKYKSHLLSDRIANENTLFTVSFLIEDVSPFGTLTHDGEMLQPVYLSSSKEFLEHFSEKTEVDWIISAIVRME